MPTPPSPTPQLPLKKGISLRWLPIGFILLQSLLYGFGDPISKSAYEVLPVYSLLTARYGIALVFLLLLFGRRIFQGLRACSPKRLAAAQPVYGRGLCGQQHRLGAHRRHFGGLSPFPCPR